MVVNVIFYIFENFCGIYFTNLLAFFYAIYGKNVGFQMIRNN